MANYFEGLQFNIIYSSRKSIAIELRMDGILVRAPKGMSCGEINAFIHEKRGWIEKHLVKMQDRKKDLEQIPLFTRDEIRELAKKALVVIPEKVKKYAPLVGVTYGRITIRNQRSRWGSCSSKGNLNFNCLLMLFPEDVMDYVVVHELCHRKQMNHSAEFYVEVERVFPEYRKCQKWLKENGGLYLARLPQKERILHYLRSHNKRWQVKEKVKDMKIIVNKIKCKKCRDVIESKSVHDFKFCKCGAVAVDGGQDYLKRCGNREDWEELSGVER